LATFSSNFAKIASFKTFGKKENIGLHSTVCSVYVISQSSTFLRGREIAQVGLLEEVKYGIT